jgi:hypothetical protein
MDYLSSPRFDLTYNVGWFQTALCSLAEFDPLLPVAIPKSGPSAGVTKR